jgi:hypothetical protein
MFIAFAGKVQKMAPLGTLMQSWKYNMKIEVTDIVCKKWYDLVRLN